MELPCNTPRPTIVELGEEGEEDSVTAYTTHGLSNGGVVTLTEAMALGAMLGACTRLPCVEAGIFAVGEDMETDSGWGDAFGDEDTG